MKNIINYIFRMGFSWFVFRIKYFFRIKFDYFIKNDNKILEKIKSLNNIIIPSVLNIYKCSIPKESKHIEISNKAIDGEILVFSNEYLNYQKNKKSNYNPVNKYSINNNQHWSKIPDFGKLGDIKIPWEYSRSPHYFSYIKAHKITKNDKYLKAYINDINCWIDENKYPHGINYKCGQEMTFRLFSFLISVNYFYVYLEKEELEKISSHLSFYGYRIESNIDYAVISVKNDHAISEAIGLILCGLLYQGLIDSDPIRWFNLGKKILLNELKRQVYSDGSYLCHSFNYQREVLDELTFILLILKNNYPNERELIECISTKNLKMIIFLNSFIQINGWLPNYGSNDGAYLYPICESDYRDYRDSLNFAYGTITGNRIFDKNSDLLDFFSIETSELISLPSEIKFDEGGYYILKNYNIFAFIRCHTYKDRPSQNDMLHLDIWHKGKNLFSDAGTFSYNTKKELKDNFQGVKGHNTIMINNVDQMEQVLNFGWSNWTKAKKISFNHKSFYGENFSYNKKFGVLHSREVYMEDNEIIIIDSITNVTKKINIKQIWNTKYEVEKIDKHNFKLENCVISSTYEYSIITGYISDYYNSYKISNRIIYEIETSSNVKIKTIMKFN